MSTDAGSPIAPRPPFRFRLPKILKLRIRRVKFKAPELRYFKSSLAKYDQAVEFTVEIDRPVPIRAYGPALFIGNVEVNHSELVNENTWRFLHFEPKTLRRGAAISWGWMKDPRKNRVRTEFRYEPEEEGDRENE